MISEELKTYLIGQFKENETDLLLRALEWKNSKGRKARYFIQAIETSVGGMATIKFDTEENKFIDLQTEVIKSNGKAKLETIKLSDL